MLQAGKTPQKYVLSTELVDVEPYIINMFAYHLQGNMTKLQGSDMIVSAKLQLAGATILFGLLFSAGHSATFYVKPNLALTSATTCPHSDYLCLSLTEYGQNYDQHFNVSDIELKLLPGIHVLEVSFIVANIPQNVKLLGSSSSTEVSCRGDVGITFENVSRLTIDGLRFISCKRIHYIQNFDYIELVYYGFSVYSVHHTTITNCTFQNSPGTALAVVNSSAVLGNTSFLDNCQLRYYYCSRGGIHVTKSSLNFTGITLFARNNVMKAYGSRGGGVRIENFSTVIFSGTSTFKNNGAQNCGGGIFVQGHSNLTFSGTNTFVNNSAADYAYMFIQARGGGICACNHAIVNMNGNTTFIHNSADLGGGISAYDHIILNVNGNTTFVNNLGVSYGGGVYVADHTTVNLNGNTTFESNLAFTQGGGIFAQDLTILNMNSITTFISNVGGDGGGILASNGCTICVKGNARFWRNIAGNGGGITIAHNSTLTINKNYSFMNNSANHLGGGVAALKSTLAINGYGYFEGNLGQNGGAISVQESVLTMKGNHTFTKCLADVEGGAMYINKSCVTFIGETVISHNRAMDDGGGVYALDSNLTFLDSANFVTNSARRGGRMYSEIKLSAICKISKNSARRGGGIYSRFSEIIASGICKICSNLAHLDGGGVYSDSSIFRFSGNSTLNNNQAQIGAGIYLDNSTMNLARNSDIEENVAIFYGAGIYTRRSLLNLTGNNTLQCNTAMKEGGAIYATANSTLNFNGNNTFTDSVANVSGGAVWLENSILNLDSNITFRNCRAGYEGGAIYAYDSHMKAGGKNTFISNNATRGGGINIRWTSLSFNSGSALKVLNNSAVTGGGIFSDNSTLEFNETCTFQANLADYNGAGLYAARSNLRFFGTSNFHYNQATRNGGGIYARENSHITLCGINNFEDNLAERGGGVDLEDSALISNSDSCFKSHYSTQRGAFNSFNTNHAETTGGGIFAMNGTLSLQGKNMFNGNTARRTGGGMYVFDSSLHFPGEITLTNNSAEQYGGGLAAILCKLVSMSGSTTMKWNSAHSGGAMCIDESTVNIDGSSHFFENQATSEGGTMHAMNSRVNLSGSGIFKTSMAEERGGAIFTTCSNVTFNGNNCFQLSLSQQGAGIFASHSNLIFQGNTTFMSNTATYGGAIELLKSNLVFASHSHHTYTCTGNEMPCLKQQKGSITGDGKGNCFPQGSNFVNNTAFQGGAVYLDQCSKFELHPVSPLCFKGNKANESGGAIYAADVVGQHLPGLNSPFRNECFFHIPMEQPYTHLDLRFDNNSARKRGSVVYGGLLSKCDFSSVMLYTNKTSAVDIFNTFIQDDNQHSKTSPISSDPTQICFCINNKTQCADKTQQKSVFAGQRFEVSVVAIDQASLPIPAVFHTKLNYENRSYVTETRCTNKEYSFTSANYTKQIMLYPNSVSGETEELIINITLKDCPPGFKLSNVSGKCECDHRLQRFASITDNINCNINTQAIFRTGQGAGNFWVGVSYNNETYDGLILHRNCPLNYCTRRRKWIHLSDSSEQCDFNRTGLLCGQCMEGESSILGSSQCRRCGNERLFLLIPFVIAGVSLVVLLFLLDLTVAAGTIHGLIFYANIIASNHHIFLQRDQSKVFTVFISWLNLDFGFETCFYNGMDTFFKTCLQLVFPLYIWALVGALSYISCHSLLVSKLLGTNTIPVLATLFFLSYAKLLRIILVALSLTSLHYPSGEKTVWLYDANIPSSWYIPLAVAAALFLLFLFLPYTFLLLLGQWLQAKSYLRVLSWANNLNMKAFLDAYHAPYKLKHRYWTGLLLLLRCVLYLVFASNVSGESSVNLLAISLAVLGVTVMLLFTGRVYKNWTLNALEVSFIVNLGILTAATHHVTVVNQKDNSQEHRSQVVATYISIGVAFLTFLGILLYHIYLQIKSRIRKYKLNANQMHHKVNAGNSQPEDQDLGNQPVVAPTTTVVQLREPLDLLDPNTP